MDSQQIAEEYMSIVADIDIEARESVVEEHNDAISTFSFVAMGSIVNAAAKLGPLVAPLLLATSIKSHMTLLFLLGFEAGVEYGKLEAKFFDEDPEGGS